MIKITIEQEHTGAWMVTTPTTRGSRIATCVASHRDALTLQVAFQEAFALGEQEGKRAAQFEIRKALNL
jgi:hypothetical protein